MSFPSSPVNGQQVTVNDILYTYNSTKTAWIRTTAVSETLSANNFIANTATIAGNVVAGHMLPAANVTYDLGSPSQRWRTGYFAANTLDLGGSTISIDPVNGFTFSAAGLTPVALSGDSSVTADIANLYANAGVQAGQITSANTNMKGYVDGQISTTTSAITTANTNLKGYTDNLVSTANVNLKGYVDAANTIQSNQIAGANAAIVSANTAMKSYVDQNIQGLNTKPSVRLATTGNLIATYDNGTLGVGATLTSTTNGAFPTIDGVTADTVFDGVLVKNQTLAQHNGRYFLSNVGAAGYPWILTRCTYCDEAEEIPGAYIFVQTGTLYGGTGWIQTVANPATFTVGTDVITVTQFSGAGTYTAGTGLTLNGTEFSVNASQTQITSVGTLGNLTVTGNISADVISANSFIGDGSQLSGLPAGYTNSDVADYLPTHSGNVGGIFVGNVQTNNYFYANGAPVSFGGGGGTTSASGFEQSFLLMGA